MVEEVRGVDDAQRVGDDVDLRRVVHRVGDDAVDIGDGEAGVLDRGGTGFDGEAERALAGVLADLRDADADDGGLVLERRAVAHRAVAPPSAEKMAPVMTGL